MHCRLNFQLAETIVVLALEILDSLNFKHSLDIIKQIRPNKILAWNLHSLSIAVVEITEEIKFRKFNCSLLFLQEIQNKE